MRDLKPFQKVKMHAFLKLKSRWNRGGSAAMPAATESDVFLDEGERASGTCDGLREG